MHHKRKRPKSTRAGCLICKPYKRQGFSCRHVNMKTSDLKRRESADTVEWGRPMGTEAW